MWAQGSALQDGEKQNDGKFELVFYTSLVTMVELSTSEGATPQQLGSVNVVVLPDEVAADDTFAPQSYTLKLSDIWQQLLLQDGYGRPVSGEANAPTTRPASFRTAATASASNRRHR
jgi:hypothetical protein